ncbi:MAG: DUF2829 domain-containing protein [Oscillospiraceae bacterium]|nr:DUF2829 domain-containing protein [Oscillospiraceae bacterium]
MKKYIGTKIVEAMPMVKGDFDLYKNRELKANEYSDVPGYLVKYPSEYESWSPAGAFEEAYRPTDGMPFGLAIEAIKKGKKAARRGWNGKEQYIELATNISYMNAAGEQVNAKHKDSGSAAIAFVGTRGVQLGWLASQSDMLSDDWFIVEE